MNSQPRKPSVLPGRVTGGVTSVVDADLLLPRLHSPILRFAAAADFFARQPQSSGVWRTLTASYLAGSVRVRSKE
jgi:hypothetical protein